MSHPNEEVFDVEANALGRRSTKFSDHFLPDKVRNGLVIVLGEFFGTFLFLLLSFIGAQTAINNNDPFNPKTPLLPMSLLYIASSFGTALAVNVWIFYRVTGGMFNPAVTLGLVLVGAVEPLRALLIVPAQLVAGIAAAGAVNGMLPGPLKVANTLGDRTTTVQGLFLEVFLTSQLVLTVYLLAVEKHRATHLAPVAIGISVFVAHLAGTFYTGTSLNPARSLGPAVLVGFTSYHWIYWLGPVLGALLAYMVYSVLKWLDYETANPGQDTDNLNKANALTATEPAAISSIATSEANLVGSPRPKTRDSNSMFSEGDARTHQARH